MTETKDIKSIDLSSITTIGMGVYTVISIIIAVILLIILTILGGIYGLTNGLMIIPVIICGAIVYSILHFFGRSYLYNVLVSKLNNISFNIENGEVTRIEPVSTALIIGVISLICFIVVYCISMIIIPALATSVLQTLIMSGQTGTAMLIYNIVMLMLEPRIILVAILASFVISFIIVLIGLYVYNILAPKIGGITVDLSSENKMTTVDYVDSVKTALIFSIISLIIGIIISVIMICTNQQMALYGLYNIIGTFAIGFINMYLICYFYNKLSPKMGKLKVELE